NVFPIMLPPLRERQQDIPLLVAHFVQKFAERQGKSIHHIPDHVMETLKNHSWPGNIRELQNFIERAVIMTEDSVLSPSSLSPSSAGLKTQPAESVVRTLADAERAHILATLSETKWVVGGRHGAAAKLALPRTTLIARMQKLGISREMPGAAVLQRAAAA